MVNTIPCVNSQPTLVEKRERIERPARSPINEQISSPEELSELRLFSWQLCLFSKTFFRSSQLLSLLLLSSQPSRLEEQLELRALLQERLSRGGQLEQSGEERKQRR